MDEAVTRLLLQCDILHDREVHKGAVDDVEDMLKAELHSLVS